MASDGPEAWTVRQPERSRPWWRSLWCQYWDGLIMCDNDIKVCGQWYWFRWYSGLLFSTGWFVLSTVGTSPLAGISTTDHLPRSSGETLSDNLRLNLNLNDHHDHQHVWSWPCSRLVGARHTAECQLWAVWALANLTTVSLCPFFTFTSKSNHRWSLSFSTFTSFSLPLS